MTDYLSFRSVEQAVVAAARRRGLNGNPLADDVPRFLANANEELLACDLYLDCPKRVRLVARSLIMRMARSIIFTSTAAQAAPTARLQRRHA
jgi:predicted GNAT superfamily acetyltransferase